MNADVKTLWIAALRSDSYKQGTRFLCKNNYYCCLGVLCDIFVQNNQVKAIETDNQVTTFDGSRTYLPFSVERISDINMVGEFRINEEVKQILDDQSFSNDFTVRVGKITSLSELNDLGVPFNIIADIIEIIF